ncbi:MAG: MFS transporter [Pseudomonadota bacterium]
MNSTSNTSDSVTYTRDKVREGPVPLQTKILQGFGALPGSHKDFAFNSLLLLYYTQILGVSATATSMVLATALIIDAITDPLVGAYSDNLKTRLGRRHPLMYVAALPLGLMMYLLFSPPEGLSHNGLVAWLFGVTVILHLSFTFFVVPWNALAAEFTDDYVERTSIIAFRHLVGWIGGVIFGFSILSIVFAATEEYPVGQLNPANFEPFGMIAGSLTVIWCLFTTHMTRKEVPYLLQPRQSVSAGLRGMLRQCFAALQSPNYRLIIVGYLTFIGIAGITGVFDSFMNTFFWGLAAEDLRWLTFTIIGAISAIASASLLQARFLKQHLLLTCLFSVMVLSMLKVTFRLIGWLPENGDPMLIVFLVAQDTLIVYCMTVGGIMFASMIADLVDEQEIRTGMRQEGVFSSVLGFASKASSSLGLIIGGLMLDHFIHFPRGEQPGEIDPDILFRLAIADGLLVNIFILIPVILLFRYSLTRENLADIQAQLKSRRT